MREVSGHRRLCLRGVGVEAEPFSLLPMASAVLEPCLSPDLFITFKTLKCVCICQLLLPFLFPKPGKASCTNMFFISCLSSKSPCPTLLG